LTKEKSLISKYILSRKLTTFLASFFLISTPFFDVPRVVEGGGITIALPLALVFLFFYFFKKGSSIPKTGPFFFLSFIAFYSISYLINVQSLDDRAFNHIVFYALSFFVYYIAAYAAYCTLGYKKASRLIYIGLLILASIGTIEILVFFTQGFSAYANFLNHGGNVGIFAGFFPRMRSLFNEPSHLALYVIGVTPIVWSLSWKARALVCYLLVWSFSTSAAFGLVFALATYMFYRALVERGIQGKVVLLLSLVGSASFFKVIVSFPLFYKLYGLFQGAQSTDSVRANAVIESLEYIDISPVYGLGPTYYYDYFDLGLFNLYLQLYIESGLLGLTAFLLFIGLHISRYNLNKVTYIMLTALLIQYVGMNHYYIPGLWMLLAFMAFKKNKRNNYHVERPQPFSYSIATKIHRD
jgi:hypothetical protein